jgi:hypothetical protein
MAFQYPFPLLFIVSAKNCLNLLVPKNPNRENILPLPFALSFRINRIRAKQKI